MRLLIKIYFDLLKKHRENELYPQLEVVQNNLKEKLHYYKKQLLSASLLILDIEHFLLRPIPIPPFLTKELLSSFLNEIYIDLKPIKLKVTLALYTIEKIISTRIRKNKIQLYLLLFILLFIIFDNYFCYFNQKESFDFCHYYNNHRFYLCIQEITKYPVLVRKKIPMLENLCQQTQDEIDSLEEQIRNAGIYDISDLERQVDEWLERDKLHLIQLGKDKLKIEVELEDQDPILSFIGINSREFSESRILITDRELEKIKNRYTDLLIDNNDVYEEKGLDGKFRYGIYECFVIFLCETSLSYYKCYWNFIKGACVDEETCEYLFYSIVSVKTQERSSLNQQDPDQKRKYRDLLSLTNMDGKIVYFKMDDDKKQKINSNNNSSNKSIYVSDINKAAERIRYWLRQKRVDYQITKDIYK